jgi:methionine biosynthesis protein MetW
MRDKKTMKLLELGCGYGEFIEKYRKHWELYGVDKDSDRLEEAKKKGIHVEMADLDEYLPDYPTNFFDAIICNHVIEHLKTPYVILTETRRILKDNGKFIILTPNLTCWHNRISMLFGRHPRYADEERHLKVYSPELLKKTLNKHSWEVSKIKTLPNKRGVFIIDFLDFLFSKLGIGSNIYVKCEKRV